MSNLNLKKMNFDEIGNNLIKKVDLKKNIKNLDIKKNFKELDIKKSLKKLF